MPYYITDQQPGCDGWATVKANPDDTLDTLGCHATKQDAIDQMIAVSIAENMEPGGEWNSDENRIVSLEIPAYIKSAAQRGVEYYEDGLAGDGVVDRTIREARQMARGEITSDKVIRANAWSARHMVDLDAPQNSNPDNDGWPGAGAVAFYLWGIDPLDPEPAMRWFESKSDAIKNEERSVSNAIQHRVGDTLFCMDEKRLETRRITLNDFELREAPEGDGMTFSGYAAVFNSESEPLPFRERIMPGAFDKSLRSRNDIRMYLNHDTGRVLASRRAGTLRLTEDRHGLLVEADLPPTTDGRDLSILMKRGDVDSMSFGFSVPSGGDWWSEDGNTRELREVRLHEVSVVTGFPAYTATTASVRSLDELIATQGVDPSFVESAMMKLSNGEPITADEASLISSIVYELTESPDQIDPSAGIPDDMQELVNPEVEDEAPMGEVSESPAKVEIEIEVTVRELQRRQRELDLLMRRV